MNGIKYLLDTNVIIGLYEQHPDVLNLIQNKNAKTSECGYSAITRIELLSFSGLTTDDERSIELLLSKMAYFALTPEIENETIAFRRVHKTKLPDSIIAATAKHFQLELLTLDKKLTAKL